MSVSSYTNWGNWVFFFLLWINVRLRPAEEGLGSAPSPLPLLTNEVPQYDTAPDDSEIKQKTQTSYTIKQCSTPSWQSLPKNVPRDKHAPEDGMQIWNTILQPASQQTHCSLLQLSSHCLQIALLHLTNADNCQKSEVCTGSKSTVIIPSRFF